MRKAEKITACNKKISVCIFILASSESGHSERVVISSYSVESFWIISKIKKNEILKFFLGENPMKPTQNFKSDILN